MNKTGLFLTGLAMLAGEAAVSAEKTITFFDDVVFYDGTSPYAPFATITTA